MVKRKKFVIANWKMNPETLGEAKNLFGRVKRADAKLRFVETVVCPPFVFLGTFAGVKGIKLGAQDVFWETSGRFTGQISSKMLKALGVSYVIIGHSERRALGETDDLISKKVKAVLGEGMKAVLCVGEKERDQNGAYFEFLKNQITQSLDGVEKSLLRNLLIAYEPIWAVGKSFREALKPVDIRETIIFIRKVLSDAYGRDLIGKMPIIYGGAVETENICQVLEDGDADGVLVGHKSLTADDFILMMKNANEL